MKIRVPYRPRPDSELHAAWMECFGHRPQASAAFDIFRGCYREPGRFYHTIEHGHEVSEAACQLGTGLSDPDAEVVYLAAWAHDAHYDPAGSDNESKSAEIAVTLGDKMDFDAGQCSTLHELILVSTHQVTPRDELEGILCDADLAGLAKSWAGYRDDVENIRAEMAIEAADEWNASRHMILDFFEHKAPLYHSAKAVAKWDVAAR